MAVYIRWSTDDQGDGTTLEVQMEGCRHYTMSQGWNVNDALIYIDDGYSGGSLDRPAMSRLRQAVQAGQVDCVVVFKLDRLSRSVVDTVNLVLQEWDDLCHVKSAREPIDTTNHAGKMFFYMLVSYAEWERSVIRERTWGGRLKRAQEGRSPGLNAPYGYQLGEATGTLEVVPAEAGVVRRIYAMYQSGYGVRAIFNTLNADGVRFREGRLWSDSTIRHILTNPVYCGDLVWGRRITNPRYGKREGERSRITSQAPLAVKENAFPAIISRAVWEQVQAVRQTKPGPNRGGSGRAVSSRFLLTGLARCKCGAAIIGREGTGRGTHTYYICSGKNAKGSAACDCGYINTEKVDAIVVKELLRLYGTSAKRERLLTALKLDDKRRLESLLPALHQANQEWAKLMEQDRGLRKQYREKEITLAEFRAFKSDLDGELEEMSQRRDALTAKIDQARLAIRNHALWERQIAQVDAWDRLATPEKKSILRALCKSVTLYRKPRSYEVEASAIWAQPSE